MENEERSYITTAEEILRDNKEPMDFYDLFDHVLKTKDEDAADKVDELNEFYTQIVNSAKFVYTGSNTWDLKARQKVDLWTKDGSFYNEYKEVQNEELDRRLAEQAEKEKRHQEVLGQRQREEEMAQAEQERREKEERLRAEEEAAKAEERAAEEAEEEIVKKEELEEIAEKETVTKDKEVEVLEEKEPEHLEDNMEEEEYEEDFDEEEYHDIMDQYEDEYDKD